MAVIERGQQPEPVLHKEVVYVEGLGGEVVVRGLYLDERLTMSNVQAELQTPRPDETPRQAMARASAASVPRTLELCVLLADEKPCYSAEQWRQFGSRHLVDVLRLFGVAMRLSGQDLEAAAKNSEPSPSEGPQ